MLLLLICVGAGGVYLALPWLIERLAPALAADYGILVHRMEVGRPGSAEFTIFRLDAEIGELRIRAEDAVIGYRLGRLLEGELETLTIASARLIVEAADAGSESGEDTATLVEIPDLAAVFAAVPFSRVEVRRFALEVPEVGFVGTGDVSFADDRLRFELVGDDPEPAQLLVARGSVDAQGMIEMDLAESGPDQATFLALDSQLGESTAALSARLDLSGYPYQLVRSLLQLPPGDGMVRGELRTTLPHPFELAALQTLDVHGDLSVDWRSEDGGLRLSGLEAAGRFSAGTVQARFSGGTLEYQDETLFAQAVLAPETALNWTDDSVELGGGVMLRLDTEAVRIDGVSDPLTLTLANEPRLRAGARLDVSSAAGASSGVLTLQALQTPAGTITGSGSWTAGPYRLPFEFGYHAADGSAEVTSAARLDIAQPLAATLLTDWQQDYDLLTGALDYQLDLTWRERVSGSVAFSLGNGSARFLDDVLYGIGASGELEIAGDALSLAPLPVSIASVDPGVPLTALEARIGWQDGTLRVEQAGVGLLGGRARFSDFSYDPGTESAEFSISLEAIDLAELLALEGEHIRGEGRLDGQLPVEIRGGAASIRGGRLQSQAPGGVLRLSPNFGALTGQPGLDFALRALTDYRYESLTAGVDYDEDGELKLDVSLKGRNPQVEQGRPIHYNLTVTENVLVLLKSLRAQRAVTEGIERRALGRQLPGSGPTKPNRDGQ